MSRENRHEPNGEVMRLRSIIAGDIRQVRRIGQAMREQSQAAAGAASAFTSGYGQAMLDSARDLRRLARRLGFGGTAHETRMPARPRPVAHERSE